MSQNNDNLQFNFFLGTNRTGTTALTRFFQKWYPSVSVCHQLESHKLINILSTMYLQNVISENFFNNSLKILLEKRLKTYDGVPHIETNGWNYVAANYMIQKYNKSKVVHLVRDPRDFITSYITWINSRWKSYIAYNYLPFWNVNASTIGSMSKAEWSSLDHFGKMCWMWSFRNQYIEEKYSSLPGKYHFVRFEDIINIDNREEQKKTLQSLLSFLSLPYVDECEFFFDKKINASKRGDQKEWNNWSKTQEDVFHSICGPLMEKYGYE